MYNNSLMINYEEADADDDDDDGSCTLLTLTFVLFCTQQELYCKLGNFSNEIKASNLMTFVTL